MSRGQRLWRFVLRTAALIVGLVSLRLALWIRSKAPEPPPPQYPAVLQQTTDEDRLWMQKAQQARLGLLDKTRTAAKDWGTTITAATGILGVVALIEGPEKISRLTRGWEIAIGITLLVALLLLLRGIILAALAAQGTPKSFRFTPRAYRRHYNAELQHASALLQFSRLNVVLGTLALIAAVGMTWYGTEEKKTSTHAFVVRNDGGAMACGDVTVANGMVQVKDIEGSTTLIDPTKVALITPAGSCPGES